MKNKYGNTPIQRNWNRMAELTRMHPYPKNGTEEATELSYRIAVQNYFAHNGVMPDDYVPVGEKPKWIQKKVEKILKGVDKHS